MALARSRLTTQGQISVPAEVRRRLGVGPGALLEWDEQAGHIIVRRAGSYTSEDIHLALFRGRRPTSKTVAEMKAGVRRHTKSRRARH